MGQGQPRVIIWTTLVELPYTMLHTKFQGHRSIGSGEEDFLRFLPYMGVAAMLVMWPRLFEQLFFPKGSGGYIWNLVAIGPVVSEEKLFEIVDGRRTTDDGRRTTDDGRMDGRTTDDGACLYYKLPRSLRLRWAKNISNILKTPPYLQHCRIDVSSQSKMKSNNHSAWFQTCQLYEIITSTNFFYCIRSIEKLCHFYFVVLLNWGHTEKEKNLLL